MVTSATKAQVNFKASKEEYELIAKIARRANMIYLLNGVLVDTVHIMMNLTAAHLNGCPLKLKDMLAADDLNLMHDIGGIDQHINRDTGKLENQFVPRFAV
jgi:hypothetical protein